MSKTPPKSLIPIEQIEQCIHIIREQKVMLDQDLARLYEVETKYLKRAVLRNTERFPEDFMFQLNKEEWNSLRCQIGTSKKGRGGQRYMPYAFTEQGVAMLSSVLNSSQAIRINIEIIRAFIKLREFLASQKDLTKEVIELKSFVLKHAQKTDQEFRKVWQAIEKLSEPPTREERRIGFDTTPA